MWKAFRLEQFIRNRPIRIALAFTLIALSVWAFMPYFAYRIAPSAFINAELMRVTAPIAGRFAPDTLRKGDFIAQPAMVTLIQSLSPDRRHLLDLDRQYAVATENAQLARRQLDEITAIDDDLGKRIEAYRGGMVKRLSHELNEAEAERTGCLAEDRQRRDVGSRMEALVKSGTASRIRSAEALATQEATSTRCQMAEARHGRLQVELSAAQSGVFLRDGANDVPYSQQQRDRLLLRRQELETHLLQESSRSSQFAAEIAEERSRLARADHYDLSLPADHVVWSVAASPGSMVTEGQTVLDLADCDRRFVAVELPERDFEQTKAGDMVAVRLIGSSDWSQGRVRQVRGSAARTDDRLLAAQVPNPNPGNITVEITLSQDGFPAGSNSFCNIGRLAEVRFHRTRFGLVNGMNTALQWFIGSSGRSTVASN
jgi:multidrug resistance efflux pump